MPSESGTSGIWDVHHALRRMGEGHYDRYRDTYNRVGVMANATAGLTFQKLYHDPAVSVLARIRTNVARPDMVGDTLLTSVEKASCVQALHALEAALAGLPADLSLYQIATSPASEYPTLIPLFKILDGTAQRICVPFVQPEYDPATAKASLDDLLALVGTERTYSDLYEREPTSAMKPTFNGVMVRARRAGLLVELRGLRRPAAPGYVSDPADDRWDVRSCVAPENAVLFRDVHLKINTTAYLMNGLTYGDFFNLPMIDPKVLPHVRARVMADQEYWFTPLEKERVVAALDAIVTFLSNSATHKDLNFRMMYSDPQVPAEVLVQFQRVVDVKPEICLPFLLYTWDHVEADAAIDVFLVRNSNRSLKSLYTDQPPPPPSRMTQSEFQQVLAHRDATRVLLAKENDLICDSPGNCTYYPYEYCTTGPWSNCSP